MYCSVNDFFFAFILKKNLHCAKYHHFIFVSCLYCFYFKIEIFYFKLITAQPGVNAKKLISV